MKTFKSICIVAIMALVFTSCKNDPKTVDNLKPMITVNQEFKTMLDSYYEDGLILNPLAATYAGDNRFNDKIMQSGLYVDWLNN